MSAGSIVFPKCWNTSRRGARYSFWSASPILMRLEDLLEQPERAPFYDLLGGLADNLLTIGAHAGTFLACNACRDTFSLKGESWKCERCGEGFELKFKPAALRGSPLETMVRVSGLSKPRFNPHWYFDNENWSVAEFVTQILRLQPEEFLRLWFRKLGVEISSSPLETVLCWPRFRFGGKTIQPDLAIGFEQDIVLFGFKRPMGGKTPPVELMGKFCFGAEAERCLSRRWHLVLIPGREPLVRTTADYVAEAVAAVSATQAKWAVPLEALAAVQATPPAELANRMRVFGWETLLRLSLGAIRENVPDSWTRCQALEKLAYFHSSRAELGLLSPP